MYLGNALKAKCSVKSLVWDHSYMSDASQNDLMSIIRMEIGAPLYHGH